MKIHFNGVEITGQKIDNIWEDCLHLGVNTTAKGIIMNDNNRIWLKLDKTLRDYNIARYPYRMASFDKNSIIIIED
jgi:hypothetical protein